MMPEGFPLDATLFFAGGSVSCLEFQAAATHENVVGNHFRKGRVQKDEPNSGLQGSYDSTGNKVSKIKRDTNRDLEL
jgi:hypothetical protein